MKREKRVELYRKRYEQAENIFNGKPLVGNDLIFWIAERAGRPRAQFEVLKNDIKHWKKTGVCEASQNQDVIERTLRRRKDLGFN